MNVFTRRSGATVARPRTISEQVADMLRESIAAGELAAGTPLRQDELAGRFGFSRMPIRDALRQLEAEGLVSTHPTRGAFVASLDAVEITEIYLIRELLEVAALRLALPRLSDLTLVEANTTLDQIDREPDIGRWGALNHAFHLALYRPCGNTRLLELIDAQHSAADRYVRILLSSLDYRDRSQVEHREILSACRRRSSSDATCWLTRHLRNGSKTLFRFVK